MVWPRRLFVIVIAFPLMMWTLRLVADPPAPDAHAGAQKSALAVLNPLIGKWRGIGQPRRGSSQGAWKEDAEWVWDFSDHGVAIRYDVSDGTLLKSARLTYDEPQQQFVMQATAPDDSQRTYRGHEEDEKLVLISDADSAGEVYRLTVTQLNEKRTLALFEKRASPQASFTRVAEVGYTRDGTHLAGRGGSGPECIVTGGTGTIEVSYKGKTYYVCCTGCRQAFEEDPEGILAEAAARHEREKAQ